MNELLLVRMAVLTLHYREPKVMQLYQQAMAIYHAEKHLKGEARVLRNLGNVFLNLANNKLAAEVLDTAVRLAREAGDNNAAQSAQDLYPRAVQRMNYWDLPM